MNVVKHFLVGGFVAAIALGIFRVIADKALSEHEWAAYGIVAAVAAWAALLILEHGFLKPRRHAQDQVEASEETLQAAGLPTK